MRLLILGGDGYLGWPTAMAFRNAGHEVLVVDNYLRREIAAATNSEALMPNSRLGGRTEVYRQVTGQDIAFVELDCCDFPRICEVVQSFAPDSLVHFAEQPSAPYSMIGFDEARSTLFNNLTATFNVIWAVLKHAPDCHIIKLGTMGEYGTPNIDIEEGWIEITHKGRSDRFLFPRQASSLYHTTKILDTDLLWFYVRLYRLRVSDLMQGPVYGLSTSEADLDERLLPNFHYDDIFGTVVNRFLTQAVAGIPLTVYGKGGQTRGYLNIQDTLQCIMLAAANPPAKGELRVLNQFTETFSVRTLATRIQRVAAEMGLRATIENIGRHARSCVSVSQSNRHRQNSAACTVDVMAQWLITGGCGFIGLNLVRELLRRPDTSIRIVDNLSIGSRVRLERICAFEARVGEKVRKTPPERVELVVGDVLDQRLIHGVTADVDVFVHLAANTGVALSISDPQADCLNNVMGTLNCLEACRHHGTKRFVFASSGASIGSSQPPLHEELAAHPTSPYGASKLAGEAYCSAYKHSFGIDTVALRFGNCYGPLSSHKNSVIAKFIKAALSKNNWEIFGDGDQTRDFIFVDDIAKAIMLAAEAERIGGEAFQIATNSETSIIGLVEELSAVLRQFQINIPPIIKAIPRVGDVKRNFSDIRKARARLGWIAQVALPDGLERTVQWFLEAQKETAQGQHSCN
jgi:UDP-sulfoquinovose synthase